MNKKQFFDRHLKRLVGDSVLKSVVIGAICCFLLNLISAFIYWMFAVGNVYIGLAVSLTIGVAVGISVYLFKFKPSEKQLMRRIDQLGLEERMITMYELRDDNSYIAKLQREDAQRALEAISDKSISFTVSRKAFTVGAVITALSVLLSTLGILAQLSVIPFGKDIFGFGASDTYTVVYDVTDGGKIIGEKNQSVKVGHSGTTVFASADDGWVFVGWDDGENYPQRCESAVTKNIVITALFEKISGNDSDPEDEKDASDDLPAASSKEESGGGSNEDPGGETPESGGEGNGGGKWQDKNQFIDGATYYRDFLEVYYQYAMDIFDSAQDIPKDIIEFFETYFSGI